MNKESVAEYTKATTNLDTWNFVCVCDTCQGRAVKVWVKDISEITKRMGFNEFLTATEWEALNHKVVKLNTKKVS
jgi:hypothetical protein